MTDSKDGEHTAEKVQFLDDRIAMSHWFPKLKDCDVPVPKTQPLEWDKSGDGFPTVDGGIVSAVIESSLDGEAFIRGGYKSAQMSLKEGSYIPTTDVDVVNHTLERLLEQHLMMQMPVGEYLWVREWLDLEFDHYARESLHPEVRVFIRDSEVVCYHPRLEGFDGYPDKREQAVEWIDEAWEEGDESLYYRPDKSLETYAERVADAFDGMWSLDFVMDVDGNWFATDMALDAVYERDGELHSVSEHPGDCDHGWDV